VLFAIPRTSGWLAQWEKHRDQGVGIGGLHRFRPAQTGSAAAWRDYSCLALMPPSTLRSGPQRERAEDLSVLHVPLMLVDVLHLGYRQHTVNPVSGHGDTSAVVAKQTKVVILGAAPSEKRKAITREELLKKAGVPANGTSQRAIEKLLAGLTQLP